MSHHIEHIDRAGWVYPADHIGYFNNGVISGRVIYRNYEEYLASRTVDGFTSHGAFTTPQDAEQWVETGYSHD